MNAIDHRDNRKITTSALYTSIKSVITLMNGLNGSIIEAGAIHGVNVASVCVAIINMNPMSNTNKLETPRRVPRMLLPPPQGQSTLPHEFSLISTGIPDNHLDMAVDGRTRSQHVASKSADNPFLAIMITPRLFPQNISETKVYKTTSTSQIAVVIIKYKKGQEILTEFFCSPIFGTSGPAKKERMQSGL